jgi:hypothetical protein
MNNSTMFSADRATHLKIVVVALLGAILVASIGIAARLSDGSAASGGRIEATVIKAARSVTASTNVDRTIR